MAMNLTQYWTEIPEYHRLKTAIENLNSFMADVATLDFATGWSEGLRLTKEQWNEYLELNPHIERNYRMVSKATSAAPTKWLKEARKIEKFLRQF